MQKILQLLANSSIVKSFQVDNYRKSGDMQYYKVRVFLHNSTILYIKEYIDIKSREYSYHWQKNTGELILRFDSKPHHPDQETFPYHKHDPLPEAWPAVTLEDVLIILDDRIAILK